jgi:hypothetical protein
MEVNTKFEIGDIVWFIDNNRAIYLEVTGITISLDFNADVEIVYSLHFDDKKLEESKLFKTKEELLKSL